MDLVFNSFVVLFIVVDPIGVAWMFSALTSDVERPLQRSMAIRGVAFASAILLVFFFIGDRLLETLGISLPAFRIAGGVLLFLLAIDMIFARQSGLRSTTLSERAEARQREDLSVFPLAFPLLAGPGALTTVLLMASGAGQPGLFTFFAMLGVLLLILLLTLGALLIAPTLLRVLGETGANAVSRLLGLLLAALAVQYVIDGLKASFG